MTKRLKPTGRRTKGGPSGPSGPSQTAAQRRANGRELLRAWLDADTWTALEELTAVHGTRTAAVSAAILGWCRVRWRTK